MDADVKRITVIERRGGQDIPVVVYRSRKKDREASWTRPLEKATERLLKGEISFGQESLRRLRESRRDRGDGWIFDVPSVLIGAARAGYNSARKAVPLRLLPRV